MKLNIIVATDLNGAIGKDNQLPWHMPADLKHFKETTLGKPVIMGRKTYESIGRPLPGRINVVVSQTLSKDEYGITVVKSLTEAFEALEGHTEAFVIGGGQLYREALPLATTLYLTKIHTLVGNADTWFPKVTTSQWDFVSGFSIAPDAKNPYQATYMKMERI
jgi:dihydrofolate reductase